MIRRHFFIFICACLSLPTQQQYDNYRSWEPNWGLNSINQSINCPLLPQVQNGNVQLIAQNRARVVCDRGYSFAGPYDETYCNPNTLTWSYAGRCHPDCPAAVVEHANILEGGSYGSKRDVTCLKGYQLSGNGAIYCGVNGQWLTLPTCLKACQELPVVEGGWTEMTKSGEALQGATAHVHCSPDRSLVGAGLIACKPDGQWTQPGKCAKVCSDVPLVENGRISSIGPNQVGSFRFVSCDPGFTPIKDSLQLITCTESGSWTLPPKCVPECKQPPFILNGFFIGDRFSQTIHCNSGYSPIGSSEITCQNGVWSTPGSCVKDCHDPPSIAGGTIGPGLNSKDATRTVTCNYGFVLRGASSIVCETQFGRAAWTSPGKCLRSCGLPGSVSNGVLEPEGGENDFVGSKKTLRCEDDHTLFGAETIECLGDGSWTEPGVCLENCGFEPKVAHGSISLGDFYNGAVRSVTCEAGFTLKGPSTITCEVSSDRATWSKPGRCEKEKECPNPPKILNGVVSEGDRSAETIRWITCNPGFKIVGFDTIACHESGEWTETPYCIRDCGPSPLVGHGNVQVINGADGSTGKIVCKSGYILEGAATFSCDQESGEWSSSGRCVRDCFLKMDIANGKVTRSINSINDEPIGTISCDAGYKLEGSPMIYCDASSEADFHTHGECVADCGSLPAVENGITKAVDNERATTLKVLCDKGFVLVGASIISCSGQSGLRPTWSQPGRCLKHCGDKLPEITNGHFEKGESTFGSVRAIKCIEGYSVIGAGTISCSETGEWTNPGQCLKDCGRPPKIRNSKIKTMERRHKRQADDADAIGSKILGEVSGRAVEKCYCNVPKMPGAKFKMSSDYDEEWIDVVDHFLPECQVEIRRVCVKDGSTQANMCIGLEEWAKPWQECDLTTTTPKPTPIPTRTKPGGVVTRAPIGSPSMPSPGMHMSKHCSKVRTIENGKLVDVDNKGRAGMRFRLTCNSGYTLVGDPTAICIKERWISNGFCAKTAACSSSFEGFEIYGFESSAQGSTVNFRCPMGFVPSSQPVMRCGADGKWKSTSKCVPDRSLRPIIPQNIPQTASSEVFKAVESDDFHTVERLLMLSKGQPFDLLGAKRGRNAESLLHVAALKGSVELVKKLTYAGADPKQRSKDGLLPVHLAAGNCHFEVVDFFVERDRQLVRGESGQVALQMAEMCRKENVRQQIISIIQDAADSKSSQLMTMKKAKSGTILQIVCDEAFTFSGGDNTLTCTDGEWSTPTGDCLQILPDSCREPHVENGDAQPGASSEGAARLITCKSGFQTSGTRIVVCKDSDWQPKVSCTSASDEFSLNSGVAELVESLDDEDVNDRASSIDSLTSLDDDEARLCDIAANTTVKLNSLAIRKSVEKIVDAVRTVNFNCSESGRTPLHLAAANGRFLLVRFLLNKGANIDAKSSVNDDEALPIHLAAANGYGSAVDELLHKDSAQIHAEDLLGNWPIHRAARGGNLQTFNRLLEKDQSSLNAQKVNGVHPLCEFRLCGTPLHLAAGGGHLDMVSRLINKGADINARNAYNKRLAIHVAAFFNFTDIVSRFVETNRSLLTAVDGQGNAPIHLSAEEGYLEPVKYFLGKGVDVNVQQVSTTNSNNACGTPLHKASANGHLAVVKFLIEVKKADPTAKAECHRNKLLPIHFAAQYGHLHVVVFFDELDHELSLAKDKDGELPLHKSARQGHAAVVKFFLEKHVPIDSVNKGEVTALHLAANHGHVDVVKLLISHGASVEAKANIDGMLPIHLAALNGKLSVVKFFGEEYPHLLLAEDNNGQKPIDCASMVISDENTQVINWLATQQQI